MNTRPGAPTFNPPAREVDQIRAKWDEGITSLVDLAAVSTAGLTVPAIRGWVETSTGLAQAWRLVASTAATADGVQRPNDYNATTNAKVWFLAEFGANTESLYANSTTPGNVGTAETDLLSYTLAAGKLAADGDRLRITCIFKIASNLNFKIPRLYFGSQTVASINTQGSGGVLTFSTIIRRKSATTQEINSTNSMGSNQTIGLGGTQNLNAAVIIRTTGQSDAASDDITQREMIIEYLPAP